jgi:L-lactate dehydrogenase (cytochrome)
MGEAGVMRALEIIHAELDVSMALCGIRNVKDASPALLHGWRSDPG